MAGKRDYFSTRDVTVTLSGEEWLAVLCRLADRDFSVRGAKLFKDGLGKLHAQVLDASCAGLQQEGGEQ